MSNQSQGPTWQTVATTTASILVSIALGAGGYFIAQQAAKDSRQDQLLDNVTTKLVDISVALVAVKSGLEEMKVQQAREITLREERRANRIPEGKHAARGARPARDGRIAPEAGRRQVGPCRIARFFLALMQERG